MRQNDLVTRAHVGDMFNDADDRSEYYDWLASLEDDDTPERDAEIHEISQMPSVVQIEQQINATIERQAAIAKRKGVSIDIYREDLADRRDILMDNLLHARAMKRIQDAK